MQLRINIKNILFSINKKEDGVSDLLFWVSGFSPPQCHIMGTITPTTIVRMHNNKYCSLSISFKESYRITGGVILAALNNSLIKNIQRMYYKQSSYCISLSLAMSFLSMLKMYLKYFVR